MNGLFFAAFIRRRPGRPIHLFTGPESILPAKNFLEFIKVSTGIPVPGLDLEHTLIKISGIFKFLQGHANMAREQKGFNILGMSFEDTNINNDRLLFSVNVRSASDLSGSSDDGGGGAFGLWMLLALLLTTTRRLR